MNEPMTDAERHEMCIRWGLTPYVYAPGRLPRSKRKMTCECCASIYPQTVYLLGEIRYCLTCLHSIGMTRTGRPCSAKAQRLAWHELVHGKPSP